MDSENTIPAELTAYIQAVKGEAARQQARNYLLAAGWKQDIVDQAFAAVAAAEAVAASEAGAGQEEQPGYQGSAVPGRQEVGPLPAGDAGNADSAAAGSAATDRPSNRDLLLHWAFRGGFALIFIINGFIAWLRPEDFIGLLASLPLIGLVGHLDKMILFTGLHDLLLGALIISGKWQKYVLAWSGLWLTLVTFIKFVSLL